MVGLHKLSDRDLVIECWIELEQMMKEMITAKLIEPMGDIEYLTHKGAQVIKLARLLKCIGGKEQDTLERLLNVRNTFAHFNGLSFASAEIEDAMNCVPELLKLPRCTNDRVNFIQAYRHLARRFLIGLYRV